MRRKEVIKKSLGKKTEGSRDVNRERKKRKTERISTQIKKETEEQINGKSWRVGV